MKNLSLMLLILSLSLTSGCSWMGFGDDEPVKKKVPGLQKKIFTKKFNLVLMLVTGMWRLVICSF